MKERSLSELIAFIGQDNIADKFEETELATIGQQVKEDFDAAVTSMEDWSKLTKKGLELIKPATGPKSDPWDKASNFKSPALSEAAYRFGERASTELLRPKDLVKAEIVGDDPDDKKKERSERVSKYMSWQVNHEMPEWRDDERGLLYRLPNMGTVFKKTFFDPIKGRLISDLIQYPNFAVDQSTPSMEELRDFTHILVVKKNEMLSNQRAGLWLDDDLKVEDPEDDEKEQNHDSDITFLEQQCFLDLDDDGYEEPYTVTIHKATCKVMRIVPRFRLQDIIVTDGDNSITVAEIFGPLEDEFGQVDNPDGTQQEGLPKDDIQREIIKIIPERNLTAYRFLPSADGSFLGVGYYQLMSALVESINTGTNQLFDAGTQANLQGGWLAKGMRNKMGDNRFKPGEFKQTNASKEDLQQGILMLPFKEPSATLLSLVQELKASLKELSASADLSEILGTNVAASTVLLMIEETQSSTTALMSEQARSMGKEFQIMYHLDAIFTDPNQYKNVLDEEADYQADFEQDDLDLSPTANPEISNKTMRIQQAQIMNEQFDRIVSVGGNGREIMQRFLEDMGVDNIEEILPPVTEEFQAQQMAASQAQQAASESEKAFFDAQTQALIANAEKSRIDAQISIAKMPEEIEKLKAEVIKTLEQAESEDVKNSISKYTAQFDQVLQLINGIGAIEDVEANRVDRAATRASPIRAVP